MCSAQSCRRISYKSVTLCQLSEHSRRWDRGKVPQAILTERCIVLYIGILYQLLVVAATYKLLYQFNVRRTVKVGSDKVDKTILQQPERCFLHLVAIIA